MSHESDRQATRATVGRRDMLRTLGVGAAAAGAVALNGTAATAAEGAADKKKQRYKETDHVKRYYESNRR
ncbi:MAG: formate dehydrogenase [Alphaproteobacteria bacterium]|nr:formate dehydrogenase [Alphaproteobacteria bacterium]